MSSDFNTQKYQNFDFVRHRKKFFALSLVVTVLGLLTLALFGLNTGVDFAAGTSLDVTIGENSTTPGEVRTLVSEAVALEPVITVGGNNDNRISFRFERELEDGEREALVGAFHDRFGADQVSYEENTVDPVIARELVKKAILAVSVASIGIIIYVSIRFEWRFAITAIIALLHDAFIVISIFSIFRLEVQLSFVAAVLTIIGYSINDTIVLYDRIRENLRFAKLKKFDDLAELVNNSIRQTLTRSINTSLTTLLAAVLLFVLGSEAIRLFSLGMLIGLISGTYSSIFIASQIWMLLKISALNKKPVETQS